MNIYDIRIVILYGGWSDEKGYTAHKEVENAIRELKIDYELLSVNDEDWINKIKESKPDVVFITNQGNYGEDGRIQAILDVLGIRYIGSGVLASSIGMNKYLFKKIVEQLGVLTPKYMIQKKNRDIYTYREIAKCLGRTFIVKPVSNGASFGVTVIHNEKEYNNILCTVIEEFGDILLEQFITHPKKEIGIGILDINERPMVLPACIIEYSSEYFSNDVKFNGVNVKKKYDLQCEVSREAAQIALKIYDELGCCGLARFDFVCDSENRLYLLEMNTLPGILNESIFPNECSAMGISYKEMVALLIGSAFAEKPYSINKK